MQAAYVQLKPGGRFVTMNDNVRSDAKPFNSDYYSRCVIGFERSSFVTVLLNCNRYGFTKTTQSPANRKEGAFVTTWHAFLTEP